MAKQYRAIQDAVLTVTRALTASDGSVTSTDIDLGVANPGPGLERVDLVVAIPALTSSELNTADTLVVLVQSGESTTPTTSMGVTATVTGTGSAIASQELHFKLPPAIVGRYVNVKFTTAGTTGDMSAKSATISLRF